MNQVEDSLLLEMLNKDASDQINEWMKLNPYKQVAGYQRAATDHISIYDFLLFVVWGLTV